MLTAGQFDALLIEHLPGFAFIKDESSHILTASRDFLKVAGCRSNDQICGKSDFELPWSRYAEKYRQDDKNALLSNRSIEMIEPTVDKQGDIMIVHVIKKRIILSGKKLMYGYAMPVMDYSKIEQFLCEVPEQYRTAIKKTHNTFYLQSHFENISKRESQILYHIIRGKTAKETSNILFISPRTVEKHLENIKIKMNCQSKSELIEKAINNGYLNVILENRREN